MADFKKGDKVSGSTVRGREFHGKVSAVRATQKGKWVDVDVDGKTVSTRPSLLKRA